MSMMGVKRNRGEEDEEGEGWKFEYKGKKLVYDFYDDDWDFLLFKGLKVKKKEEMFFKDKNMKEKEGVIKQEFLK